MIVISEINWSSLLHATGTRMSWKRFSLIVVCCLILIRTNYCNLLGFEFGNGTLRWLHICLYIEIINWCFDIVNQILSKCSEFLHCGKCNNYFSSFHRVFESFILMNLKKFYLLELLVYFTTA